MEEKMNEEPQAKPLMTYALWGAGGLDPRMAAALLSEYMPDPDDVGDIYRPERVPREHSGLRTAIDYLESPDYAGQKLTPSTDLLFSLIEARQEEGDEVTLLALWPEAPTREDFAFIRMVELEGIPVKDLSRALDDLDLSLYTEPDPPKEPKPAKARAKRPRKPKLSDAVDAPVTEERPMETPPSEDPLIQATLEEMNIEAAMVAEFGLEKARMIDGYINYKIRLAMVHRTEPVAGSYGIPQDTPPFDGPYVGKDTAEYYTDGDKNIRPAEGKPRRGEFVVNLSQEEIEEAKREGRYRG